MKRPANATWYNWYANGLLMREIETLLEGLSGARALDVGCGGQPYRSLLGRFRGYVGFDSPSRPDSATHADVFGDATALPFANASVDVVLCTEVMEHVAEPSLMLAEIRRVLVPGGHLVLSVPFIWHLHDEPWDYWRFTEFGLRAIIERAGLDVVALTPTNGMIGALLQSRCYALMWVAGPLRPLTRPLVWFLQTLALVIAPLDRNKRMTSNYVVLARRA
jgi:SAM-dependent methyltransferase